MKKEISMAIIAGGALGLLIAFAIWKGNSLLKVKNENPTPLPTSSSSQNENKELKIVLIKPDNLAVLTENPTVISGITTPNAYVVLSGEVGDIIANATQSGNFTENLDLTGGANQVVLTAFTNDGNSTTTNLLLSYSSQFIPDTTASASPVSYIGTVTDISNSNIQIKNDAGDIQQLATTTNTTFVNNRDDNVKQIKESDVAIGDYLVGMGYKDGNNILNSSRVIILDPLKKTTRTAFFGTIIKAEYGKVTVKNPKTNENITVTPNAYLNITGANRFSQLKEEDKIIAVGELKDGNIDAMTILVVK